MNFTNRCFEVSLFYFLFFVFFVFCYCFLTCSDTLAENLSFRKF